MVEVVVKLTVGNTLAIVCMMLELVVGRWLEVDLLSLRGRQGTLAFVS